MRIPTRGKHSSIAGLGGFVSNWDEGSSHKRAAVCDMRASRSMIVERGERKEREVGLLMVWRRNKSKKLKEGQ
jgi:hypothetical protein